LLAFYSRAGALQGWVQGDTPGVLYGREKKELAVGEICKLVKTKDTECEYEYLKV
jgi:hypothetical protein